MITPARFGLTFVVLFALMAGAFEATRGSVFECFVVDDMILIPTAAVINTVSPGERVELMGRALVSGGGHWRLHVTRGCEGIELLLLLAAAIVALPASLHRKLRGLLVGSLLVYLLTVGRLVLLDYTLRYAPAAWAAMHGLLMPLVPVIVLASHR